MYRLQEIMEMLSIPERTIRRHLKEGLLKGEKVGGTWRFTEQNLYEYLDNPTIRLNTKKTSLKETVNYMNGFKKGQNDIVIILNRKLYGESQAKDIAIMVSESVNPYYFTIVPVQRNYLITFIGNYDDALRVLSFLGDYNE